MSSVPLGIKLKSMLTTIIMLNVSVFLDQILRDKTNERFP